MNHNDDFSQTFFLFENETKNTEQKKECIIHHYFVFVQQNAEAIK